MTEENYNYRTSQTLLRNQFPGKGKLQIPIIPRFKAKEDDFNDLLLIGFDKTHLEDQNHLDRMVHFFLYDYRFERVWKNPDNDIEKLSRYRAVLSPDFSMYLEMAPVMQLYNLFRNRWCGAYWASKGIRVVPSVNWGDESTFDFCFDGIEKGSVVAVSTYMASEHDHRKDQKEWFLAGIYKYEDEQTDSYIYYEVKDFEDSLAINFETHNSLYQKLGCEDCDNAMSTYVKLPKNITYNSTMNDVINAYGKPTINDLDDEDGYNAEEHGYKAFDESYKYEKNSLTGENFGKLECYKLHYSVENNFATRFNLNLYFNRDTQKLYKVEYELDIDK